MQLRNPFLPVDQPIGCPPACCFIDAPMPCNLLDIPNFSLEILAEIYIFLDIVTKMKLTSSARFLKNFVEDFDPQLSDRFEFFQFRALTALNNIFYNDRMSYYLNPHNNFLDTVKTIQILGKNALILQRPLIGCEKLYFKDQEGVRALTINMRFSKAKMFLESMLPSKIRMCRREEPDLRGFREWLIILQEKTNEFLTQWDEINNMRRTPIISLYNFKKKKWSFYTDWELAEKEIVQGIHVNTDLVPYGPTICKEALNIPYYWDVFGFKPLLWRDIAGPFFEEEHVEADGSEDSSDS